MQPSTSLDNRAPRLVSHTHYCVMGDVSVADGAMIAPGVVLQAAPGSRVVIASGACLAGGVCIQSRQGVLTIGPGTNLGANVLVVGKGEIGPNACISPGSTLVNPQVSADQLVPPNALVQSALAPAASPVSPAVSAASVSASSGSASKYSFTSYSFNGASNGSPSYAASSNQVTSQQENDTFVNTFVEPSPVGPKAIETPDLSGQNGQYVDPSTQNNALQLNNGYGNNRLAQNGSVQGGSVQNSSALSVNTNNRVYGKDQVSQLLSTLFPNRVT